MKNRVYFCVETVFFTDVFEISVLKVCMLKTFQKTLCMLKTMIFNKHTNPDDPDKLNSNISVLEALYSSTSAHLSEDEVDQAFQVLAGVRQGGPESPSLFCLLMDWVMRIFTERAEKLGLHGVKLKYNIASAATNRSERS